MSVELKNLKVINGNTLLGKISISPDVPNKIVFPPKIIGVGNYCIFFADLYNDYSTIQFLCGKSPITKNMNYHFYNTTGNCIVKLNGDRKTNNFGTIRPKNIEWKFISDIKFVKIDSIPKFHSFFVFNKYPGLSELTDDDNKRNFMLHDLKNFHLDDDVFCFVSKSIYDLYTNLRVDFPFDRYKVIDDKDILSNSIETLMGKIVSSGKPFANGNIKCSTQNSSDNLNNALHAQYIDKLIDFQALRNGVVEYSSTTNSEDGEFVIFYQYTIDKILLDGKKIEYENIIDSDLVVSKITDMFIDLENIKCNGKKFVSDEMNASKTHYYKYTKSNDILNIRNTYEPNSLTMIKNIGMLLLQNIRTELRYLEDTENEFIPKVQMLGRAISDGQYTRNDTMGKLYSASFENY
jgi:hypothetical protein